MACGDLRKVAMVLGMAAFQLHILTLTVCDYNLVIQMPSMDINVNRHRVIEAFLILAYLLYIIAVILLLVLSYSNLKGNKALSVVTAIVLFFAVCSVIVGLATYDAVIHHNYPGFSSYTTTTFATDAACGLISGIVLLISICV